MQAQRWINSILIKLHRWQELSRSRRDLRQLNDRLLKDIGLSQAEAEREANRPFWDDGMSTDETLQRNQVPTQTTCTRATCIAKS